MTKLRLNLYFQKVKKIILKFFNSFYSVSKIFPQIYRIFTASTLPLLLKSTVIAIFVFFIGTNIIMEKRQVPSTDEILKNKILQAPFLSQAHNEYAQYLIGINKKEAEREFKLAQEYYLQKKVLGAIASPWEKWLSIISINRDLNNQINYWDSLRNKYPDYQYAVLMLAELNYEAGNFQKAKELSLLALNMLPNSESASKLETILKSL